MPLAHESGSDGADAGVGRIVATMRLSRPHQDEAWEAKTPTCSAPSTSTRRSYQTCGRSRGTTGSLRPQTVVFPDCRSSADRHILGAYLHTPLHSLPPIFVGAPGSPRPRLFPAVLQPEKRLAVPDAEAPAESLPDHDARPCTSSATGFVPSMQRVSTILPFASMKLIVIWKGLSGAQRASKRFSQVPRFRLMTWAHFSRSQGQLIAPTPPASRFFSRSRFSLRRCPLTNVH